MDADIVTNYVNELGQIFRESSFIQRKTFISSFIKRIEVHLDKIIIDYTLPLPLETNRTSRGEVLYIDRVGSPNGKHPELLFEKEQLIPAIQEILISHL